jgi:hypothetical protein
MQPLPHPQTHPPTAHLFHLATQLETRAVQNHHPFAGTQTQNLAGVVGLGAGQLKPILRGNLWHMESMHANPRLDLFICNAD